MHLKIHIKIFSTSNSHVMQYSNPCSWCSLLSSASHQVLQLLLFRNYTHCFHHNTKGRLNHGLQSFETCIYITIFNTYETLHYIMIRYSITIIDIDMYRRSLVCVCASICLCRCVCVCVDTFVYIYTQVTIGCQGIPHHTSGTFNKHSSLAIFDINI